MQTFQAILYLLAITLLALAAFGVSARPSLALLGGTFALTAYALPTIATLWT
ncbi:MULTISPECIES: hypothetical protein [Actinomycetes]|uniref:Uncharacterized protein n=2 Tax=Actinomycetes TaxID=1760 RepID=A0ABU2AIB7_9ACTN|nr:hypothetical protein [Glycomyces lechevalierae]MDR7336820.1 hypothetical protein [Glycomyces lechevalierae]